MSFGPQGANASLVLPPGIEKSRYGAQQSWVKDAAAPGGNDGTVLDAAFFNRIIGNLDYLLGQSNVVGGPADFTLLYRAILGAVATGAPDALNTLNELAAALGNDSNFAGTVLAALAVRLRADATQQFTTQQLNQLYSNLNLARVAITGNFTDLLVKPTLGTAAALDVGTTANKVVQLDSGGKLPAVDGSQLTNIGQFVLRNYLAGYNLSTVGSSSTFTVSTGQAADSTNVDMLNLLSLQKTTSAWSAGSANGALDTGTIANSTWYHAFVIKNPTTNTVDILVSTSATAPTMPAGYTLFRRIGSMKTDGSAKWTKFIQDGDLFMWDTPVNDLNITSPGTTAVLRTLTTPPGVRVRAQLSISIGGSTFNEAGGVYISDPSLADVASTFAVMSQGAYIGGAGAANLQFGGQVQCFTNTSQQVRSRCQQTVSDQALLITTYGWADTRGR